MLISKYVAFVFPNIYTINVIKKRYLTNPVITDLEEKMVFIGGPRQVGKTTLSTHLIGKKFTKLDSDLSQKC